MIIWDDKTKLTDAQREMLEKFDSHSDAADKVEYGYSDELNAMFDVPGELVIELQRGIEWDNERVLYLMDLEGGLEIL